MGVERSFQALPADQRLTELAIGDKDLGEVLALAAHFFREGGQAPRGPSSRAVDTLLRAVREILDRDPDLATRNCFADRRWDQIHYLLCGNRRGRAEPNDGVLAAAIEGAATIAPHVVGAQGFAIRLTSPAMVERIDRVLALLDVPSLRQHYDLAAMEARGVYKAFAGRESSEDWQHLASLLGDLQVFYADAAFAGNCVLVLTD